MSYSRGNYIGISDEDLNDNFLCSSVPHKVMQVVYVQTVIESKKYNEMASKIDEDFNRKVEEFIDEFKRQILCLDRQQSLPWCRFHP